LGGILKQKIKDYNDTAINKIDINRLLIYTSTKGDEIINPNTDWIGKWVIYSPKIVAGVDFSPKDDNKYNTYCFVCGDKTLNPEEVIQQINRNRVINELYIYIEKMPNDLMFNNKEQLKHYFNDIRYSYNNDEIFNSLCDVKDNDGEITLDGNTHTEIYEEIIFQNNVLNSSFQYNLYNMLIKQGFDITLTIFKSKGITNKEKSALSNINYNQNANQYDRIIKDEQIDTDDKTYSKNIKELIKNLYINTDEKKEKYKHLLCEQKLVSQHYLLRLLLYDIRYLEIVNNKKDINEIDIISFKDKITSIMILKQVLKEYLNINNIYDYKYDTGKDKDLDDEICLNDYYFKHIKLITKSTRKTPKTKKDLFELLNVYINHILLAQTKYHNSIDDKGLLVKREYTERINKNVKCFQSYFINPLLLDNQIELFKENINENHYNNIDNVYLHFFNTEECVITEDSKKEHYNT
jgi:hypothetical protein